MADQTTINAHHNANGKGVVGNIADFGNDIASLVELQAKLAAVDFKEATARAKSSVIVLVLALVFVLAALPVALFGIADLIAAVLQIRSGWALLITAGVVLALGGATIIIVLPHLANSLEPLRRSQEELTRNLSWVRTVMVHSGRSVTKR